MSKKGKRRRDAARGEKHEPAPADAKQSLNNHRQNATLVVRDHLRGDEHMLGAPGMELMSLPVWRGDKAFFFGRHDTTVQIEVDIPLVLPIKEEVLDVVLSCGPVAFKHSVRKRGDERFSSLDTTNLPRFSHLAVRVPGFQDAFVFPTGESVLFADVFAGGTLAGLSKLPVGSGTPLARSYLVICELLDKLVRFVGLPATRPKLSYASRVLTSENKLKAEGVSHYPGVVLASHTPEARFTAEQWELFKKAAEVVATAADPHSAQPFVERVFAIVHDFSFCCRQHPQVIAGLEEEMVRDLLLIVFKTAMAAEGESFHHRGKLDFKVVNPANKYEFVTGELKWWDRDDSAREAFAQLTREHATGQEAALVCLILCRNRDAGAVDAKVRDLIAAEPEYRGPWSVAAPHGSHEAVFRACAAVRGARDVPLLYALVNVYPGKT